MGLWDGVMVWLGRTVAEFLIVLAIVVLIATAFGVAWLHDAWIRWRRRRAAPAPPAPEGE